MRKVLDLDAEINSADDKLQDLLDCKDPLSLKGFFSPLTDIEFFQFFEGRLADLAARARRSSQPLVMENYDMAIL